MGFGKDGKGVIITERQVLTSGALASEAVIKAASNVGITEDFRIIKTEYIMQLNTFTDDVHCIIGLADNELSVTEIANQIAVNGPIDRNDHSNIDLAEKPVWLLEPFNCLMRSAVGDLDSDSRKGEKNFRWTFSNPEGWTWFMYNSSTGPMAANTIIVVVAKHFGVWVT